MTNFVFCPHFCFPSITHCRICPILQSVFLPLSFWTLQQAFAFLCTDVYISPLLKVPYLSPPHLSSLSSALLCSQVCYLWVSLLACECLSSILCSTPSELIRLWRAIYPPLKERESANFPLLPFCLTAVTYGCLFLKLGLFLLSTTGERGIWDHIDLDSTQ